MSLRHGLVFRKQHIVRLGVVDGVNECLDVGHGGLRVEEVALR